MRSLTNTGVTGIPGASFSHALGFFLPFLFLRWAVPMLAQAGLKLKILLLQPPKYWYYRHGHHVS